MHSGTCENTAPDRYRCTCAEGLSGDRCEIVEHPCATQPCKNGGTCTLKVFHSFFLLNFAFTCYLKFVMKLKHVLKSGEVKYWMTIDNSIRNLVSIVGLLNAEQNIY